MSGKKREKEKRKEEAVTSRGVRIVSVLYVGYGLVDLIILYVSDFLMVYIGVLGVLCALAAVGLWLLKRWGLWLAVAVAPLTASVAIFTLYSSVGFVGLNPSVYILMLHIALICYAITAVTLFFYLVARQRLFR